MRRRTTMPLVAAAAFSLLGTAFAPAAHAAEGEEVVGGLITPLSVAVDTDGTVYAANNFAGLLTKAVPGEEPEVVHEAPGQEVGAVSAVDGAVTFATTAMGRKPDARLHRLEADGSLTELSNVWSYEKQANPDGKQTYGFKGLSRKCKRAFPKKMRFLLPYKGIQESHPYATYVDGGTTYLADAAANAIFAVEGESIRTVAVLPAVKVKATKKAVKRFKLPKCTIGKTLRLEPVPTDVEMGPDGNLYVTSLPGGPEDDSLGMNGAVYRIDLATGKSSRFVEGLLSPVGLAIEPDGTAYVSMLFPSVIMKQELGGQPEVFAEVPFPGDVEYADGYVYASETDLMNDGSSPPAGRVLRWATAPSGS